MIRGPALGALEDPPHDVVVRGRPVWPLLQPPAVDDVADQVHDLAVRRIEEVDQHAGIAALGAEVDVADPDGPVLAAIARPLGNRRLGLNDPGKERTDPAVADRRVFVAKKHGQIPVLHSWLRVCARRILHPADTNKTVR